MCYLDYDLNSKELYLLQTFAYGNGDYDLEYLGEKLTRILYNNRKNPAISILLNSNIMGEIHMRANTREWNMLEVFLETSIEEEYYICLSNIDNCGINFRVEIIKDGDLIFDSLIKKVE